MPARIALNVLEWLAVSAATALLALAWVEVSWPWLLATGLAMITASLARGLAFRRAAGRQFDALVGMFAGVAPQAVNDDRGPA